MDFLPEFNAWLASLSEKAHYKHLLASLNHASNYQAVCSLQAKAHVAELTRALEKARCSSRPDEAIEFSQEDYINMEEIDEEMRKEPIQVSSLAEPGFGPSSASIEELEVAFEDCFFRPKKQSLREVLAEGC